MRQESITVAATPTAPVDDVTTEEDPIWQALADLQITISMNTLLNLVPQFCKMVEARICNEDPTTVATHITESVAGLMVVDHHNLP